jgi:hypothetical protein
MLLAASSLWRRVPFREDLARHQEMDWALRAVSEAGARVRWVDEVLGTWDVSAPGQRVSASTDWRFSLEWIRESRPRVTPRAYAAFVLTRVAWRAAEGRAWSALFPLLGDALRRGRPRPKDLLLFAAIWLRALRPGRGRREPGPGPARD